MQLHRQVGIGSSAAQQLAEADPAGWAIGWDAWPAGMCENHEESACFRRAA